VTTLDLTPTGTAKVASATRLLGAALLDGRSVAGDELAGVVRLLDAGLRDLGGAR
jgi:hypothetical protein